MKKLFFIAAAFFLNQYHSAAQTKLNTAKQQQNLYLDIHYFPEGVKFEDVAAAHQKDLAVQQSFGVTAINYWVDEKNGYVYCLLAAADSNSIREMHRKAHGLLPTEIMNVTGAIAAQAKKGKPFFLDIHKFGAGKVTAKDVAAAHEKDMALQQKHGVNFINYWVDENKGVVYCLSQTSNPENLIATHREAHGLLPDYIAEVKQGQ